MQSSGLVWDSRRESSVSKFSSHWQNPAAAIINGLSTSHPSFHPPLSLLMERLRSLSPAPLWLNRAHSPCEALLESWNKVHCYHPHPWLLGRHREHVPLSWGHHYTEVALCRPSFLKLMRFSCSSPHPLRLRECRDPASDDLLKLPEVSIPW